MDRERRTSIGVYWGDEGMHSPETCYPLNYHFHEDREFVLIERFGEAESAWLVGHVEPLPEKHDKRSLIIFELDHGTVVDVADEQIVR